MERSGLKEDDLERSFSALLSSLFESQELIARASYLTSSLLAEVEDSPDFLPSPHVPLEVWTLCLKRWMQHNDQEVAHRLAAAEYQVFAEELCGQLLLNVSQRFEVDDLVLALLPHDEEWHPAIVVEVQALAYKVRFLEYGNTCLLAEEAIQLVLEDEEEECDPDACAICRRTALLLTFHHLVPRETHSHVLRRSKQLPPELESLYVAYLVTTEGKKSRKDWLNLHGILVCRQCHTQIHRAESNESLALRFHSLSLLLQHPAIIRWRNWASKR